MTLFKPNRTSVINDLIKRIKNGEVTLPGKPRWLSKVPMSHMEQALAYWMSSKNKL